jgi:hypothetical protein
LILILVITVSYVPVVQVTLRSLARSLAGRRIGYSQFNKHNSRVRGVHARPRGLEHLVVQTSRLRGPDVLGEGLDRGDDLGLGKGESRVSRARHIKQSIMLDGCVCVCVCVDTSKN